MTTGEVVYFNYERLFGFIKCDETGEEIFFHYHEAKYDEIEQGDKVQFYVTKSKNKPGKMCCVDVQKI